MPRMGSYVLSQLVREWMGISGIWTLSQRTQRGLTALHWVAPMTCLGDPDAPEVLSQLLGVCTPEDSGFILPLERVCIGVIYSIHAKCPRLQLSPASRMPTPSRA